MTPGCFGDALARGVSQAIDSANLDGHLDVYAEARCSRRLCWEIVSGTPEGPYRDILILRLTGAHVLEVRIPGQVGWYVDPEIDLPVKTELVAARLGVLRLTHIADTVAAWYTQYAKRRSNSSTVHT